MVLISFTSLVALGFLPSGVVAIYHYGNNSAPCDSPLFCFGPVLHDVQMGQPRVFDDSKTFVDMPTRFPLKKVQDAYEQLPVPLRNNTLLQRFLKDHFVPAGSELVELADWSLTTNASFISSIKNPIIEEFVQKTVGKWANLTRIFNESVICDQCEGSFVPIKRPFVIAGGRFREPYCWDSYWILQGLLRTGGSFTQISRNQIENLLDNVEDYGFVPNGGRKYYLHRS
ncbi:Six-hairpin glycosidase-like protein [Coniella lustricola]|uniref:Cytosolic neutral trehalase n=1 Tax=Coniella lustricola TaxID=2025994 RepID=A0A2T3AMQ4_9PEZI|nr:Six-hairpin glycosidase-like protein [Coniella lustricola]